MRTTFDTISYECFTKTFRENTNNPKMAYSCDAFIREQQETRERHKKEKEAQERVQRQTREKEMEIQLIP